MLLMALELHASVGTPTCGLKIDAENETLLRRDPGRVRSSSQLTHPRSEHCGQVELLVAVGPAMTTIVCTTPFTVERTVLVEAETATEVIVTCEGACVTGSVAVGLTALTELVTVIWMTLVSESSVEAADAALDGAGLSIVNVTVT